MAEVGERANVGCMAGIKIRSTGHESLTWTMNSSLPGLVSERYCKSRIAVFSTGNVYGLTPVSEGGSREEDTLNPVGEYAFFQAEGGIRYLTVTGVQTCALPI